MHEVPSISLIVVFLVGAIWITWGSRPLLVRLIRALYAIARWLECLARGADAGYVRYRMEMHISTVETESERFLAEVQKQREAAEKAAEGEGAKQELQPEGASL